MKKFFYIIFVFFLIGFLIIYFVFFIEWGNKIIVLYIEKKINLNECYLSVKIFKMRFNFLDFKV